MKFSFAILPVSTILNCMKQWNYPFTKDELKNPTPNKVRDMLEHFACGVGGVNKESLQQGNFDAMNVFTYPELHNDALAQAMMSRYILKFLRDIGYHDASMRLWTAPTFKSTKRVMSAVANFLMFREEKMPAYEACAAREDTLMTQLEAEENRQAQLEARLADIKARQAEEEPKLQAIEKENTELESRIRELNEKHSKLRQANRTFKEQLHKLKDQITSDRYLVLSAQNEADKIRSQIVKSPAKLKKGIEAMRETLERDRDIINDATESVSKLQNRLSAVSRANQNIEKRVSNLDECADLLERLKMVQTNIRETGVRGQQDEERIRDLKAERKSTKIDISQLEDRYAGFQRNMERRRFQIQRTVDCSNQEEIALRRKVAKMKAKTEQNVAMYLAKKAEKESCERGHDEAMKRKRSMYATLEHTVKEYHAALLDAIKAVEQQRASSRRKSARELVL